MEQNIRKVSITGASGFIGKACASLLKRKLLGYKPTVTLEKGMQRCEAWLREQGMIK